MNKKRALEMLNELLKGFPIYVHPDMIPELLSIIQNSGVEEKVFSVLVARLQFLVEHRQTATQHHEFELLEKSKGIYSMHISTMNMNIRILYALSKSDIILLLAFFERGGKSATNYSTKIQSALGRLKELL